MPPLPTELRSHLERTVIAARDAAEMAGRANLIALAAARDASFPTMSEAQHRLHNLLAHARSHLPALPAFERHRVGNDVSSTPVPPDTDWRPRWS